MKRLSISPEGVATYTLAENMQHKLDLAQVFGYPQLSDLAKKAVAFAVGHVLRNATAGKMDEAAKAQGFKDANEAVAERVKALAEGKWTAHRETGEAGESRLSLLAQALAVVMAVDSAQAAEFISDQIRTALEEKDIDPDAETDDLSAEQKTERRKIAAAVRKSIGDDPAVSVEMQKLKLARDQAKLAEAQKAAEGKTSAFVKAPTPSA
jgi:hypothetical protein